MCSYVASSYTAFVIWHSFQSHYHSEWSHLLPFSTITQVGLWYIQIHCFFLNSIISCGEYCPSLIISCTKSLLKSISACYPMGFFSSGGLKVRPEGSSTSHFLLLDSLHEFQFWGTKERLFSINITWIVHTKLAIKKRKLTTLPQSPFFTFVMKSEAQSGK